MEQDQETPAARRDPQVSILPVLGLCLLLVLSFWPLALWLGRSALAQQQLNTGGIMVLISIAVCLRGAWPRLRVRPNLNNLGLAMLPASFACLWLAGRVQAVALPLVVFGFCAALAAMISFFFGEVGVRTFLPALSAIFVLGLLVGLSPALDWPLRGTATSYASNLLARLGFAVQAGLVRGKPPVLQLWVDEKLYLVASECNGFGLLSSSLVLAAILAFSFRLPWFRKLGLLAFAAPTAIIFNMLRIVSICITVPRVDFPYTVIHEGLGITFYAAGLGLVWWVAEQAARPTERENENAAAGTARSDGRME